MPKTQKPQKPKGHKRGCQCVVCLHRTRKRTTERNHGYENQMNTLHQKAARATKRNSTVRMNPSKQQKLASGITVGVTEVKGYPGTFIWWADSDKSIRRIHGSMHIQANTAAQALRIAVKKWTRVAGTSPRKNSQLSTRRTAQANPRGWWIYDLYNGAGKLKTTRIRQHDKKGAYACAHNLLNHKAGKFIVRKVELAGPYSAKPTANTARK